MTLIMEGLDKSFSCPRYSEEQIEALMRYREECQKEGINIEDYIVYDTTRQEFKVLRKDGTIRIIGGGG
jgi:hypothetical protein